ncbi:hypothetical protein D7X33_17415 [Butyricicoccus sp. 1XD8-22]|nr:hypothetical protein D7X33_17415 [Butyricicoccus sp. 1XD8-22]
MRLETTARLITGGITMQTPQHPATKTEPEGEGNQSRDLPLLHPAAEGRLEEICELLGQMLALAETSAEPETPSADRDSMQREFDRLRDEIDRIADKLEEDS